MISIFKRGVAIALLCSVAASHAQSSVKVGMVLPLSGPLAGTGNDIAQGARAAVDAFNQAGGLKGQKIELLIEDDRFDAKLSEELARDLIEKKGVVSLMSCFGTVSCLAVAKVAQEKKVPLLGPIAGAETLRDPERTFVYSIRANASEEVGMLLKYLSAINKNNAVVVIQDDGFGKAYAKSLESVSAQYAFKSALQFTFDPKAPNYPDIAKRVNAGGGTVAVILIANTLHSVGIIKALNDAKYYGQILNLAGQANGGFVKGLNTIPQMSVFATVTPSPFGERSPAAQAYRTQWKISTGNDNYSYIGFEAFLNAQVLLAALKRSNATTSAGIDKSLSGLNKANFYELNYSFSSKQRQAANFTDLAVLSQGTFKH
jgi:ABC-type branched-subunit amino acid transport system substrate-binding protein